jgi:hypothetical protein
MINLAWTALLFSCFALGALVRWLRTLPERPDSLPMHTAPALFPAIVREAAPASPPQAVSGRVASYPHHIAFVLSRPWWGANLTSAVHSENLQDRCTDSGEVSSPT